MLCKEVCHVKTQALQLPRLKGADLMGWSIGVLQLGMGEFAGKTGTAP